MVAAPLEALRRRKIVVNGWLLVIVLVLAVSVPTTLFWSYQRMEMHARWEQQLSLAQSFAFFGMDQAAMLVNSTSYPSNQTIQTWAEQSLNPAITDLYVLDRMDSAHFSQLARIQQTTTELYSNWICYTMTLNATQRGTLSTLLHTLGSKLLNAYANYLNYTGAEISSGPPFWYNGPSPPDEGLLQQAVSIAVDWPGLPPLTCHG